MTKRPGAALGAALLAYLVIATLVITLLPFRFAAPYRIEVIWTGGWRDIIANVALFFPLGFLYRYARDAGRRSVIEATVLAVVFSAGIETAQLFEPGRIASLLDVATNTLGALLGAMVCHRISGRAVPGVQIGRAALEMPLVGLVYLLLPLLWMESLTATVDGTSLWPTALLGIIGAGIFGTLQQQLFSRAGGVKARDSALVAATWYAVGAYPVLWYHPGFGFVSLFAVAVIVFGLGILDVKPEMRRFELPVIRWVVPVFLAYLLLIAMSPAGPSAPTWSVHIGFDRSVSGAGTAATLRLLEYIAAFTLLGYMIAEMGSRREEAFGAAARRILLLALPLAVLCEALRAYEPMHGASLASLLGAVAGSLYGGWIYHLARSHARALRLGRTTLSRQEAREDPLLRSS